MTEATRFMGLPSGTPWATPTLYLPRESSPMLVRSARRLSAAAAALFAAACADPTALPSTSQVVDVAPPPDTRAYVVLFPGPADSAAASATLDRLASSVPSLRVSTRDLTPGVTARVLDAGDAPIEPLHALGGAVLRLTASDAQLVSTDPGVLLVEPVKYAQALATTRSATTSWALDRVDQVALPLDGYVTRLATAGSGVRVAIFDTGIRWTHREVAGRVIAGFDGFTNQAKGSGDAHGHGTAVASTVGGATLGLASAAKFLDIRVLNAQGSGTSVELVRGVDFLLAERKKNPTIPVVANFSLGFAGGSVLIDSTVARLVNAGIAVVAAAGNDAGDACRTSPARLPAAITVGASDARDARATFSAIGSCVDVFAPGVQVLIASAASDAAQALASGTSFSSPITAGAVATALAANVTAKPAQLAAWVVRDASTGRITGLPAGTPNRLLRVANVTLTGTTTAPTPVTPPPTPVTPAPTTPAGLSAAFNASCTGLVCTLTATATGTEALRATYTWTLAPGAMVRGIGLQRLTVRYGMPGTYTLRLDLLDASGRLTTSSRTVVVKA